MTPIRETLNGLLAPLRAALPLRYTVALVVMLGVATPAGLLLVVEQRLSQMTQSEAQAQAETTLLNLGTLAIVESMWEVDRKTQEATADRLLESPQVMAVRITGLADSQWILEKSRKGYSLDLESETLAGRLQKRTQTVQHMDKTIGSISLWFDPLFGQNAIRQRRNLMAWLVAVQVLASLVVLIPLLISRVLNPVEKLKLQATDLLDLGSDSNRNEFVWKRQDELGMLGNHLVLVKEKLRELLGQLEGTNSQLLQLALYDQLTKLPNRTLFIDLVQREILLARRTHQRFGIFFIDLDRFKVVNDSLGHAAGDALLVEISRRLCEAVREIDVVCRQSGDEFLVLVRNIDQWESLGELAERVLNLAQSPVNLGNTSASVSASIGIAMYPDDASSFEDLVKCADVAMYQAKSKGRARYSFFHAELNTRLQATLELEQELEQAIATGQLLMHYQPQVSASTGELVGVEALVRWQHPKHGLLYPGAFIGIAEESGKITQMGLWTLNESCRQWAAWRASGIHVGVMAVNVSALEFKNSRLIDNLQSALTEHGMRPTDLEVEITESMLMEETDTSQKTLDQLRQLGVGIAIDDFGTGYSSLSYLKRLKPKQLKIDQSFVSDCAQDSDSQAIIKGVVGLCGALGLTIVAEGVESADQLQFLRESGCHTLQGYFVARPMPAAQLQKWITARAA